MPAKNPISMNEVRSNGAGLYVSMFFLSKQVDGGSPVDQFYWVRSNSAGAMLDERDNKIPVGGFSWWSDKATALANIPDGYGSVSPTDDYKNRYDIGYLNMFPFDGVDLVGYPTAVDRTKSEYAELATLGLTECMLTIEWDSVFSTYTEQTTNANSSWTKHDDLIDYFKDLPTTTGKPMGVCLRIKVAKDDSTHYDLENPANTNGWYGLSNSAKDQLGYPVRIGRGFGHTSFAYSTGVSQALDFVSKVVSRYKSRLGSQLIWCSVVFSAQDENGYNYENQHYVTGADSPVPAYPADFDHSTHSISGFRTWLASAEKYNNNIEALRTAWGSSDSSFATITPPGVGLSGTHEQLNAIYATNKGKDWYEWNVKLINSFMISCESIMSTAGVHYATETGSDIDVLSPRRHTIDVKRFVDIGTMHKTQLGAIARDPSFAISVDVLRENYVELGGVLGTEINDNDFIEQLGIRDPLLMESVMKEMIDSCLFDAKAQKILFISRKERGFFNVIKNALLHTKARMANPIIRVPATMPSFTYSINQILTNGIAWLKQQWAGVGGSVNSRVRAIQSDSNVILPDPVTCNFPYQIFPIQNYCLNNENLRASYYNHDFESLKNTHFLALLPTHSISYVTGQLSLCDYKITGNTDGIVYVKNTQSTGHQNTGNDSQDNNHPRYLYNAAYFNDAVFVLPLSQSYTIEFTAKNANAISATVEFLDINPAHQSTLEYRRKLSTAGTAVSSYSFNPNSAGTNFIRQIKFNCNRLTSTDTDANV